MDPKRGLLRRGAVALMLAAGLLAVPGALADPGETPLEVTDDVTPPERIHYVQPAYPEEARKNGIEGQVVLELVVGSQGDVESVKVAESNPAFDETAAEAARQWKFRPALKDGKPVSVITTVTVKFRLDGKKKTDAKKEENAASRG